MIEKRSLFVCLVLTLAAVGCATEQQLTTPQYTLTHPDYWKVKSTASKPGEPTVLSIGRYNTSVMDTGEGNDSEYEKSESEVDVRIIAWPLPPDTKDPSEKVAELLVNDPDLQLAKHGRLPDSARECGQEFKKKYTIFQQEETPLDLLMRPGFRTIVVGGKAQGNLYGVVARVPFEQDVGLFCHNRKNLQLQLQNVLNGLTPTGGGGPPPAKAAGS
jgi:hypothetical protein